MSCRKTADPIDMWFGAKARMGPRDHVLVGGPDLPRGRGNFEGCSAHRKCVITAKAPKTCCYYYKENIYVLF